MKHPRARRDGLIVQKVEGETLVYDLNRHRAFCLSPAAAVVWESSDGSADHATLARRVSEATGVAADAALVELALSDLGRARLLETAASGSPRVTRRELVRRAGLAAGICLVASIVAPTAAQAATACTFAACTSGAGTPNCCCDGSGPPGQTFRICKQTGPNFSCNGPAC